MMAIEEAGNRYSFVWYKKYFWKDITKPWFWKMWGVKRTLWYIATDWITIHGWTISFNFIEQWSPFFKFITKKDYNWIDFSPIWINFESGGYKGKYFDLMIILLGIGFGLEIYNIQEREEFVAPLLKQIEDWKEERKE